MKSSTETLHLLKKNEQHREQREYPVRVCVCVCMCVSREFMEQILPSYFGMFFGHYVTAIRN